MTAGALLTAWWAHYWSRCDDQEHGRRPKDDTDYAAVVLALDRILDEIDQKRAAETPPVGPGGSVPSTHAA